jgi:arylsulfatase A-like enzyme
MSDRPIPKNVIWITTDHMRFDNIAAHGNPGMVTPNLDRLVHQGVTFTNSFIQHPVCMGSRCSFMTSLYPQQTGVNWNGHCLAADFRPTVAQAFSGAGYQTTQIGKLHFQPHEDNDLEPKPRNKYGFDIFYLAEEPGCYEDAYMTWLRLEYPQYVDRFRIPRSSSPDRPRSGLTQKHNYVVDGPWEASFSGWIASMADNFLAERYRRHKHQFMHLGFYAPHPPANPTPEMLAPYDNIELPPFNRGGEEWGDQRPLRNMLHGLDDWPDELFREYKHYFRAMVTGVDMAVGKLLQRLEATGDLEDTLIYFCSDHGDMCGDHRMIGKGYTKHFDEVMRVPSVFYWPKGFGTQGRRVDGLIEMVDILPTLLELCDAHVPDMMVGRSYAAELLSGAPLNTREDVIAYSHPDCAYLRSEDFQYCRYPYLGTETLFDMRNDPRQKRNIVHERPEVVRQMRDRMLDRFLQASRSALEHHYLF